MEAPPRDAAEHLPINLLLKIAACSFDVATVAVRFAATSKHLRRAILGTGFLRHLADRAESHGDFDPALLLGVSYATYASSNLVQPSPHLRFDAGVLRAFRTVSARDGPLVLWRNPEVRVCNTLTGRVDALPCIDDDARRNFGNGGIYPPALLAVGGAGTAFELLDMNTCLRCRTFSSGSGEWGDLCFV